jgi:hypothetical protein
MRCGNVVAVLLVATVGPAAQLGHVAVSSAVAGVTRITMPVNGTFSFSKEIHDDKIVVLLKDVRAASTRTDVIEVPEGPVLRIRIGNHETYTTIALDLRMRADVTFSESAAGLVVDVRGTGALLPPATPPKTEQVRQATKQQATTKAEDPPVDLRRVPEVPPSYVGRDSLKESLAGAAETRLETPAKPATTTEPPAPQPAVPVPTGPNEKQFFPDTSAGPSLPPVNESQVDLATDIALFTAEDKENAVTGVLKRYSGFVAFGSPKEPGYVKHMIRAADWSVWALPDALVSLAEYRAFRFTGEPRGIVDELRQKHGIPPDLVAYAVFPDPFDRILMQEIRRFAARQGQSGKVVAARFAFSLAIPQGVSVLQVRVGPGGR